MNDHDELLARADDCRVVRTHTPDLPFGCATTWGAQTGRPDTRLHVCNLPERHPGSCHCKCGDVAGPVAPTGDDE